MNYFKFVSSVEEQEGKLSIREKAILRTAFHIMLKDRTEKAELHYHIVFEDDKQRDDYDLVCSCGALYHFEDENEVNSFIENNFYCSACGRKWKVNLSKT